MTSARFTSKLPAFLGKNEAFKDMLMGHMAMDIEVLAKARVPVSNTKASGNSRGGGGHLQSAIRHERNPTGTGFRVVAKKSYAAYQERGMRADGSHVVRHYSTSGTGAHWFKDAIDKTRAKQATYIAEVKGALGL
jgi:hypothetical protein